VVRLLFLPLLFTASLFAQTGDNVLLVVNRNSEVSRKIGEYYRPRRSVPIRNVCTLSTTTAEEIDWKTYLTGIEQPIAACLKKERLVEKVLYIVTTLGVPLKVDGPGSGPMSEHAAVDSELALLYGKLKGEKYQRMGWVPNPLFMKRDAPFRHPAFPLYAVTRLAAYDFNDVKAMIDRSLAAATAASSSSTCNPKRTTSATTGCAPPPCSCPPHAPRSRKPRACSTTSET